MCKTINWNDPDGSKSKDPRYVTVGPAGKNTLFTRRGNKPDEGFVRIDGKTVAGFVPGFDRGGKYRGKVFYAYLSKKNGALARQLKAA